MLRGGVFAVNKYRNAQFSPNNKLQSRNSKLNLGEWRGRGRRVQTLFQAENRCAFGKSDTYGPQIETAVLRSIGCNEAANGHIVETATSPYSRKKFISETQLSSTSASEPVDTGVKTEAQVTAARRHHLSSLSASKKGTCGDEKAERVMQENRREEREVKMYENASCSLLFCTQMRNGGRQPSTFGRACGSRLFRADENHGTVCGRGTSDKCCWELMH